MSNQTEVALSVGSDMSVALGANYKIDNDSNVKSKVDKEVLGRLFVAFCGEAGALVDKTGMELRARCASGAAPVAPKSAWCLGRSSCRGLCRVGADVTCDAGGGGRLTS